MNILISSEELSTLKWNNLVPISCKQCAKTFHVKKNEVTRGLKKNKEGKNCYHYCSKTCESIAKGQRITYHCKQCNKAFTKCIVQTKKYKNTFCSLSCSSTYRNAHKTTGFRRSKCEIYIESKLLEHGITVLANSKLEGYELDLFLPDYSLAIEVNGPTHYKPIYGEDKFQSIQNRDIIKQSLCIKHNIKLLIYNISNQSGKFTKDVTEHDKFIEHLLSLLIT